MDDDKKSEKLEKFTEKLESLGVCSYCIRKGNKQDSNPDNDKTIVTPLNDANPYALNCTGKKVLC